MILEFDYTNKVVTVIEYGTIDELKEAIKDKGDWLINCIVLISPSFKPYHEEFKN